MCNYHFIIILTHLLVCEVSCDFANDQTGLLEEYESEYVCSVLACSLFVLFE